MNTNKHKLFTFGEKEYKKISAKRNICVNLCVSVAEEKAVAKGDLI
jgi:hypothetical protein